MKLSTTVNFFIYDDDGSYEAYKEDLRHYAAVGYQALDAIFCQADAAGSPLRTAKWMDWAKTVKEEADRLGITFVQTHLPFYNFCDPITGIQADTEEILEKAIVCTKILGVKWTIADQGTDYGSVLMEASRRKNLEYFSKRLELAEKHDVGICIENMADFPGQGFKRNYGGAVEPLCELVDTLSEKFGNAGVCWDFGHANLMYPDQAACLRYVGGRLKVTHVHDNNGTYDEHRPPYMGTVNWEAVLPVLKEIGYEGDFSFEVRRMGPQVPRWVSDSLWAHLLNVGKHLMALTGL